MVSWILTSSGFPRGWSAIFLLLLAVSGSFAISRESAEQDAEAAVERYVCPPCGCEQDGKEFSEKGSCPTCGMAMVAKSQVGKRRQEVRRKTAASEGPNSVAILVFPGVQIIDFTGPYEVFGQGHFEVFTVWQNTEPLETSMGMKTMANYSFDNCPPAKVFVIPGGNVGSVLENPAALEWITKKAEDTEHVLTVCNGAFILAKTGLIDGKSATTFYGLIESLKTFAPDVKVVSDRRYVDNGKYITTAGLSSGIDGSLYVISKILGLARAQATALNLEYDWKQDSRYARADFADRRLVGEVLSSRYYPLMEAEGTVWQLLKTEGDHNRWSLQWQVETELKEAAVMAAFGSFVEAHGWRPANGGHEPGERTWRFDSGDETWQASALARPMDAGKDLAFYLSIRRSQEN